MDIDEVLDSIERVLLRQLNPIERLVLRQSWVGQTYSEMAQHSGYESSYIKGVGSQLWQELSDALGERTTKKNLHLVLPQYQSRLGQPAQKLPEPGANQNNGWKHSTQPEQEQRFFASSALEAEPDFPTAPLPLGSSLYINRPPIEEQVCSEISRPGCVLRIKAPAKMGKSSLLLRVIAHARNLGYRIAYIDFQEADDEVFASLDKFLRWLSANVTRQLNLQSKLNEYWDEDMGSKVSCKLYFEEHLLEQIDRPLVLAFNEVNRVFEHVKIAQDFLPMLRAWHEQSQQVEVWQKLRLVIAHATEVYVPLKLNQSPFNVGLSISLPQFNLEQVQELAARYGLNWKAESGKREAIDLLAMVGGHPYLVNVALYHLSRRKMSLEQLLQTAPTQTGVYSDHLRSHWVMLHDQLHLLSALRQVMLSNQSVPIEAIAAHKLESMGLIQLKENQARPSCRLYQLYFHEQFRDEKWMEHNTDQLQQEIKTYY